MTYTLNLAGLPFMAASIAALAGAFGGTDFERGVAGMLVLLSAEAFTLEVKGEGGGLAAVVGVLAAVGLAIYAVALVLVLGGLS